MAWNAITAAQIASGKPSTTGLWQKVKDCLEYLFGLAGTTPSNPPNGSFEIDSDADGTPDRWTLALYPGGTFTLSTTAPDHGAQHAKFTHPGGAGNGGGSLTSDYIECGPLLPMSLFCILWASAAGMKLQIQVQYYTKAKVANGAAVTLYSSTANPTSPALKEFAFTPTALSGFFKVILIGGYTDTDVAGSAYFDSVWVEPSVIRAPATVGECLTCANDTVYSSGTTTSYVLKREIRLDKAAHALRIKFELASSSAGNNVSGRIYINDVAVGTARTTSSGSYTLYSEDFTGPFKTGDLMQLYLKDGGSADCQAQNFRIFESGGYTITL